MDLDSFLLQLYVIVDTWVAQHPDVGRSPRGRPVACTLSEVMTLAILQQWPRWRSERDFWRFADRHLRGYFPQLLSQSQLNRRIRQAAPHLQKLQRDLAIELAGTTAAFRLIDTSLVPAMERVRAGRHRCFAGEAGFGRCVSKTAWVYGFKVGIISDPDGVITTFGVAAGNSGERQIGDGLIAADRYPAYLADKGFVGARWEAHWRADYGAVVAATPKATDKRALTPEVRRWSASHRQRIEGVFAQLKDLFGLERHRAKQLDGFLARTTSKITAYTCGQVINRALGRPLCQLADLLV